MSNILYRLSLGRNIGQHDRISDSQFERFRASEIDSRLAGYSLQAVQGYWQGLREDSVILSVIGTQADQSKLEDIATRYCELFSQESVLLDYAPVTAQFVSVPVSA